MESTKSLRSGNTYHSNTMATKTYALLKQMNAKVEKCENKLIADYNTLNSKYAFCLTTLILSLSANAYVLSQNVEISKTNEILVDAWNNIDLNSINETIIKILKRMNP